MSEDIIYPNFLRFVWRRHAGAHRDEERKEFTLTEEFQKKLLIRQYIITLATSSPGLFPHFLPSQ